MQHFDNTLKLPYNTDIYLNWTLDKDWAYWCYQLPSHNKYTHACSSSRFKYGRNNLNHRAYPNKVEFYNRRY